jgi:hypothetical protein
VIDVDDGKLKLDFVAYRRMEPWELERHARFFLTTKEGRRAIRKGGALRITTTIGGRDQISGDDRLGLR